MSAPEPRIPATIHGDGGYAFPQPDSQGQWAGGGLSVRDYFAAHALVALGNHDAVTARGIPWLVDHAYMVADAMLERRSS